MPCCIDFLEHADKSVSAKSVQQFSLPHYVSWTVKYHDFSGAKSSWIDKKSNLNTLSPGLSTVMPRRMEMIKIFTRIISASSVEIKGNDKDIAAVSDMT